MNYRFLIYISYTYAFPIGEPLEKEIQKRGYEVKWFADVEETKKKISKDKTVLEDIQSVMAYQPHVILSITDSIADFIPGIKVQVFHGFLANKHSFKKGHFRIRGLFDLYCTQGPSTTGPFKELQKQHKHFEVIETGWSKVDSLFPIEKNSTEKPVILISSTFSPKYSLTYVEEVINEIKRLSKTGKWEFKIVLHPKLAKDKIEIFKAMQNENLTYYDTTDIIPLFKQADIMFSDTTSAITEFILQKKPVVTFKNNKPGEHFINITEVSEIEYALSKALTRPQPIMEAIQNYIDVTHPYSDGNSSQRVINSCIEFLNSDRSHLKKKPLNLIRKFKVRKKLGFYPLKTYRRPPTIK
ncbi:CDP-glycerol glycerophosphotransferase family protein [Gillisia limnaea]|uniref:CDP-glycerol:poly(Glycerophosphate)glycerophosph otransferase n=1 Tax=Gillisia limnaea (strain DSM 15749 / LMG 21470 / R-8282) TaxID=865937 RepID=H2BRB8_GILLR|nr:CDP-glycerol glycerophosphotransferase family protein [Gillisia limnaea]EHQ04437.1 CDP-glycerol:poly(glycerophosphate)glycerophosph otransferase [Gillisia limnaea DSM 15749]